MEALKLTIESKELEKTVEIKCESTKNEQKETRLNKL
jgi:hypothetical protein